MAFKYNISDIQCATFERLFNQPVMQNYARPHYVETMVALALKERWAFVGEGWAGWDFERTDGLRLEVKQSARNQVWNQINGKVTRGVFGIEPKKTWFESGGSVQVFAKQPTRPAEIYIFAWHGKYHDSSTQLAVDHRDPFQWRFYILPETILPNLQKSISLKFIERAWFERWEMREGVTIDRLEEMVDLVAATIVRREIEVTLHRAAQGDAAVQVIHGVNEDVPA